MCTTKYVRTMKGSIAFPVSHVILNSRFVDLYTGFQITQTKSVYEDVILSTKIESSTQIDFRFAFYIMRLDKSGEVYR